MQQAHAFQNHLFVAAAKNVNVGSVIVAPWGEILAYNGGDADLIWADVDLDARPRHHLGASMQAVMANMRRPAVYGALASTTDPVGPPSLRR